MAATREEIGRRYGPDMADAMTWSRRNTVRDMVTEGLPEAWRTGPILADATSPDVIVARATTDGEALDLVLHPGGEGDRFEVGLARLKPGRDYRVAETDDRFTAGADGTTRLTLAIHGRTPVAIVPA